MSYYELKTIAPKSPARGIELRVIPAERMTMAFFNLAPHAEVPQHAHPHEKLGTVLRGAIELFIGDEKRVVNPG